MGSEVQENKEKKEEGREETTKGSIKKMLEIKRAVKEQQEESSKKQKVEEEKESEEVEGSLMDDELKSFTNPNYSSPTITKIKYTMAGLEFCSKHNMVAYLEMTDGNTEFHQIMDFLIRSSIYYALTVSPIVSTSFVEQFWTTAKSRTVNNISYIDATVAGKPVTISEASIRSDLLLDDADGIDSLNN
ncbi:hypothetical protein Tco_0941460 [Tanacetum coccineum]|uniref:Xylulose kinase-1 n=1 Tax=Tanacetum coccineum TaxID=301880 RepID=A0ABQ5DQX3_9ASTR